MKTILRFLGDHISATVAVSLAIITFGAIMIPSALWADRITVENTVARVVNVGEGHTETYQCGSNRVGDVSVPVFCNRTEYTITYAVANTDERFTEDSPNTPALGTNYTAYKVIDADKYSYSLMNPKSTGFMVMMLIISVIAAVFIGIMTMCVALIFD